MYTRTKFSSYINRIKNLGTPDSPLENKKFRDHQWQNVTNLHKSNLYRNVAAAGFVSIQAQHVMFGNITKQENIFDTVYVKISE